MGSKIFANKMLIFLKKYKNYSNKEEIIVHYGLETIYILISKLIIVTIISIIFNITKEMYIFIIFYGLLRLFAGGLHLSKSINCTIFSTIVLIGLPILAINSHIYLEYRIIVSGISLVLFALYSPADTVRKPMINKEKRIKNKIKSYIMCFIYFALLFILKNEFILNCITYSTILESFLICPLTYKVFNKTYNNYMRIIRKEE